MFTFAAAWSAPAAGQGQPTVVATTEDLAAITREVGADRVLGQVGQGLELTKDWFVEARLQIAANCLGASIRAFGLDVVTDLCDRLLRGGAPGLHFYTMNQAGPTCTIWQRLGL